MNDLLKTPFELKREVKGFILLRNNNLKLAIYYLLCPMTFFFLFIVLNKKENLKKYLYDVVENIKEADHIMLILTDSTRQLIKVENVKLDALPYVQLENAYMAKYANKRFYYHEKERRFKIVGNLFVDHINQSPIRLEKFKKPLDEAEYKRLFNFYGVNTFSVKMISIKKQLSVFLLNPINLFNTVAAIYLIFVEHEFGLSLTRVFILSVIFSINRGEYVRDMIKINKTCNNTADVTVFRLIGGEIKKLVIKDSHLTVGDIVEMKPKKNINFDCAIISGSCIVDQSTLTGEAIPVVKKQVKEGHKIRIFNKILSGSKIFQLKSEKVYGVVTGIGFDSFQGNLVSVMTVKRIAPFRLYDGLLQIFTVVMFFSLPVFFYAIMKELINDTFSFRRMIYSFIPIMIFTFPLSVQFCLFLCERVASQALNKDNIKKISGDYIVKAGRMNTVCFDKTGTLTEDSMKLYGLILNKRKKLSEMALTMEGHDEDSQRRITELLATCNSLDVIKGEVMGDPLEKEMFDFTKFTLHKQEKDINYESSGSDIYTYGDQTRDNKFYEDDQLKIFPDERFKEQFKENDEFHFNILRYIHFDSTRKLMSIIVNNNKESDKKFLYCKGAPEVLIKLCRKGTVPGDYNKKIESFAKQGLRLLAMGYKVIKDTKAPEKELESDLIFLGLIVFINPLKPGVKKTIKELHDNDIHPLMITGDSVNTAINIGYSCGIVEKTQSVWFGQLDPKTKEIEWFETNAEDIHNKNYDKINDSRLSISLNSSVKTINVVQIVLYDLTEKVKECRELNNVFAFDGNTIEFIINYYGEREQLMHDLFSQAVIFGRTSPYHKKLIVSNYKLINKNNDFTVGFVGDGANDAEALFEADIGLSLGNILSSMVASYFTEEDKIAKIKTISIEGKFALVSSIEMLYYTIFESIIHIMSYVFVVQFGLTYTAYDFLIFIPYAIPVYYIKSLNGSSGKMNYHYPMPSFLSRSIFMPFIITIVPMMLVCVGFFFLLTSDDTHKPTEHIVYDIKNTISNDHYFIPNKFVAQLRAILINCMFYGVALDYPFRKHFKKNIISVVYIFFFIIFNFSWFFDEYVALEWFRDFLYGYARWPNMSFDYRLKFFFFFFFFNLVMLMILKFCLKHFRRGVFSDKYEEMEKRKPQDMKILL